MEYALVGCNQDGHTELRSTTPLSQKRFGWADVIVPFPLVAERLDSVSWFSDSSEGRVKETSWVPCSAKVSHFEESPEATEHFALLLLFSLESDFLCFLVFLLSVLILSLLFSISHKLREITASLFSPLFLVDVGLPRSWLLVGWVNKGFRVTMQWTFASEPEKKLITYKHLQWSKVNFFKQFMNTFTVQWIPLFLNWFCIHPWFSTQC